MKIDKRHGTHPDQVVGLSTEKLRSYYLVPDVFVPGELTLTFSHIERMVTGGAMPLGAPLALDKVPELTTGPFLAARELGIINVGGAGRVTVDGSAHDVGAREGMYVPMGTAAVTFESANKATPAKFFLVSTPAHQRFETVKITLEMAKPIPMGSAATSNERVINKYVDPEVCRSAQLLLGLTALKPGSVWNTMPCHRHDRRSETYFYFDMQPDTRVIHLMGEPHETRHVIVANEQAVISPPWSIHSGCGTASYTFIWAMGGENIDYKDLTGVPMETLR
jgi:4-deoxy-L-threo-5-hexosulose-uronate ketol-isomerase